MMNMNCIKTMWKLFRCSPDFTRARRSWSIVRVTQMCDWCARMIQDVLALKVHMPHFCGASKRKKPWRLVFCKIFGYTWTDTRCNLFFLYQSIFSCFFLTVPTLVVLCKSSCQDIHPSNSHTSSQAELEVQPGKHNARMNYSIGEWCEW